jgi:hypothetical protein
MSDGIDDEEARNIIQAGHIFGREHHPRGSTVMPEFISSKEDVYAFIDKTFAKYHQW